MSDDLERRLDRMYRSLEESAHRAQSRWRSRPGTRRQVNGGPRSGAAWAGAGVAAAAAVLLLVLALRSGPAPVEEVARTPASAAGPDPRPLPAPPPPAAPPAASAPVPVPVPVPAPPAPVPPATPVPAPAGPAPSPAPSPPSAPPASPPPAPAAPPPPTTRVARAEVVLRETEGTFDLADRGLRGKQKDVTVAAGDRLRTSTGVAKLTLAEDRALLLAPRSVVEFRPEDRRLTVSLEQGEILADLVGPGPELRVVTRSCDVTPLGTVFSVKVVPGRSIVTVEKGRVDVQSVRGRATLRPAESMQAAEDGTLGAAGPADLRSFAWARGHRPAELTLYAEDFSRQGAWEGDVDKGVARAVARPGAAPLLHLASDKPLFEVPVRGALSIACRADRASRLKVQFYASDVKTTYKVDVPVLRSSEWRTLTFNFDDFVPSDRTKATGRPAPGAPVTDLLLQYGEEDERGTFWVDAIRVTESRP